MFMKPRVKGGWQAIREKETGITWCLNELSYRRMRIDDGESVAWTLLRLSDGTRRREEIVDAVVGQGLAAAAVAEQGLDSLGAAGLLEDAALAPPPDIPSGYLDAFKRNAYYFSEFEAPGHSRFDMMASLYRSRVAMLGLGGTGSWVVATLLSAGVGHLRGIDMDTVGPENLGRQILYRTEDVGKSKARAMADEVARFNPAISFEGREGMVSSVDDVRALIDGCDFLVVGCVGPRFTLYRWVNQACLEQGIPYLVVETRRVGPLVVPRESACNTCYELLLRRSHGYFDAAFEALDRDAATTERMPQFGPLVAYSGTRAGLEVARYLSGSSRPETLGRVLQFDSADLQWQSHEVPRRADCPDCSQGSVTS